MAQMDPRMAQAMAARQQQQGGRPQGRPMPPQAQGRPQGRPMPPQGGGAPQGAPQGGGQNQIMQALAQIMQMLQVLIRQQGGGAPQGAMPQGRPMPPQAAHPGTENGEE